MYILYSDDERRRRAFAGLGCISTLSRLFQRCQLNLNFILEFARL